MKEKSIKINYLLNASYQGFALLVPLIVTPHISRVLGAKGVGTYSFTYAIVCYFTLLAALGTATYGARAISIHQDVAKDRSIIFFEIFIFRFMMSGLILIMYLLYVVLAAEDKIVAFIQGFYIVGVMFDISWFFQGLEDFKKIFIRNIGLKIINIIYIFAFIRTSSDLWKYVFGLSFLTFLGNLTIWGNLHKYIGRVKFRELRPFKHSKVIVQLFIPTVAVQIYAVLDKSMIGWFSPDASENGYYEQAEKIVKMCLMLITSLGTVMIPRISKEFARKNYAEVKRHLMQSYHFTWFLGVPMLFGVTGIAKMLVPIFFGVGYEKVSILLPILSILFVSMGMNNVSGTQYLICTEQQNKYAIIVTSGGIVNVILNLILIPSLYSVGAAIASVCGESISAMFGFIFLSKTGQIEILDIWKISINYLIAGSIMLIGLIGIGNVLTTSLLNLIIMILGGVIIYFVVLIYLRDSICLEGILFIKKVINKLRNIVFTNSKLKNI
ncbi:MAG: polysaccharide biosynthesis protein [Lachnospiraceae bacterium]|jgi:O-antigen/teichoic acid export membrane protein|nr:polysaccharide biosynthesis protein [Lachnospiraceae bacterium]